MQDDEREFETEVRRIADSLWPSDELGGNTILAGRERDGLYITQDVVNLLEATTSRKQEKAEQDIRKIVDALGDLRKKYSDKGVKGWFITRDEPTPDQRDVARKYRGDVVAESLKKFRRRLIDADLYLRLRGQYKFGSARDPDTKSSTKLPDYLPLDVLEIGAIGAWSVLRIAEECHLGGKFVLLGDFGAGKSMTMHEIFQALRSDFSSDRGTRLPVHLNLRDHHGQTEPAEALERHARNLGFPSPHHVVRAWRSGEVDLLLDGFDELGSPGWMGSTKRMSAVRHSASALVRNFVEASPRGTAVMIAGRQHFFDSTNELRAALGLSSDFRMLTLNEFSTEQIVQFLRKRNIQGPVPDWLPGRPLLVAYIAARGFVGDVVATGFSNSPAESWDHLVDRICEREAALEINLDGPTVRMVVERLASSARTTSDGLGPISFDDMTRVFKEVCGYPPDDKGMVLLLRLPGLGLRDDQMNTRQFIDEHLADAARAGDVSTYLGQPFAYDSRDPSGWSIPLGELGVELVAARINNGLIPAATCRVSLDECQKNAWMTLASDVARIAMVARVTLSGLHSVFIRNVDLPLLELDSSGGDYSAIEFQDSVVHRLEIDPNVDASRLPTFSRCLFGNVEGRVGPADLPQGRFSECEYLHFGDSTSTTAGIMDLDLSPATRVALTILKKLYLQRGSGRREAALHRGLDGEARRQVPNVLQLLEQYGLIVRVKTAQSPLYIPVRSCGPRVRRMLAAPSASEDPLLARCQQL